MSKVDSLPKIIEVGGEIYELAMHITAFKKICLCYKHLFETYYHPTILSQVVEPTFNWINNKPEFSEQIQDIIDVPDFDSAVSMLEMRVKHALENEQIKIYGNEN